MIEGARAAPLKVLIVDDAVVVRRVLGELLVKDPGIAVVGAAKNGREGLEKLALRPDIIVLDVEMPEVDGLQMLDQLRARGDKTPVVMFSSVTAPSAEATLRALGKGASDYVTKPTTRGAGIDQVVPELIAKLKLHGLAARRAKNRANDDKRASGTFALRRASLQRPKIVVVAASTGGPIALGALLSKLSRRLPVPVLVVQHMPDAVFTEALTASLAKLSTLPVEHARAGRSLMPGVVVLAAGGSHLTVVRGTTGTTQLKLTLDAPLNGVRPAADLLFSTAAELYGAAVLGVVLTGMGQDGLRGAEAITRAGGSVIVQDEATSVIWGMPGAIAKAGLASGVHPLSEMAREVSRRFGFDADASVPVGPAVGLARRAQAAIAPVRPRRT